MYHRTSDDPPGEEGLGRDKNENTKLQNLKLE